MEITWFHWPSASCRQNVPTAVFVEHQLVTPKNVRLLYPLTVEQSSGP